MLPIASDFGTIACGVTLGRGMSEIAACFVIDLPDLGGAAKLRKLDAPVRLLISF